MSKFVSEYLQRNWLWIYNLTFLILFLSLASRFRLASMSVKVFPSRNVKRLLLHKVEHLSPVEVYQKLRHMCHFDKLYVHEIRPLYYVYIILYRNNDNAAQAHHAFRTKIGNFGAKACVEWLGKGKKKRTEFSCCVQLQRGEIVVEDMLQEANYCCFRI